MGRPGPRGPGGPPPFIGIGIPPFGGGPRPEPPPAGGTGEGPGREAGEGEGAGPSRKVTGLSTGGFFSAAFIISSLCNSRVMSSIKRSWVIGGRRDVLEQV